MWYSLTATYARDVVMVTWRFRIPSMSVRLRLPHPIFFALAVVIMLRRFLAVSFVLLPLLIITASAEGLLDFPSGPLLSFDSTEYYSFSPVESGGLVSLLADGDGPSYWGSAPGGTQTIGGTRTENYGSAAIKIGPYTIAAGADVNVRNAALGAILLNANNVRYTDYAIEQAFSGLESGMLSNIYNYLVRSNLDSVYGEQLNLRNLISGLWGTGDFTLFTLNGGKIVPVTSWRLHFKDWLYEMSRAAFYGSFLQLGDVALDSDGSVVTLGDQLPLPVIVSHAFVGLSKNLSKMSDRLHSDLVGSGEVTVLWQDFLLSDGSPVLRRQKYTNILSLLADIGSGVQKPLARLAYVWADEDDIRISNANKPVKDEIEENFVGDGESSIKPSDIGDMADFSSGLKDAFSGSGSLSDVFSLFSDSRSSWFFSEEVARDLDQVNAPSGASVSGDLEHYFAGVDVDEDGFVHPKSELWDVASFGG